MNILSFVNSNAIRDHLKSINYQFNSLEAAWLIYSCHRLSYEEKKEAWLQLIREMPDCAVPKRPNCKGWPSLHEFLKDYIRVTDNEIRDFYKEEPSGTYVYMYSYYYKGDISWTEEFETSYPSLEKCLEELKKDVADLDETYYPESTGLEKYRLRKQSLYAPELNCGITCTKGDKVFGVDYFAGLSEEDSDVIDVSFDGLWFDFPTPFKKGDIVWVPKEANQINWDEDGGFVLEGLSTWDDRDFIKNEGDTSDMNGYGCFVNPNGTVYHEVMENYMDLEFYNGPYKINEGILPALSMYMKGEVSLDFLLCAYRKVLLTVASDDIMLKSFFLDDWVEKAGLIKGKH